VETIYNIGVKHIL